MFFLVVVTQTGDCVFRIFFDMTLALNSVFRSVRLSALPPPKGGAMLEIPSSCSVLDAAKMLEERDVLSAPVFDETASLVRWFVVMPFLAFVLSCVQDASWSDKYLGIIDHIDIVWWMLDLIHSFGLPPNQQQHQQTILASFASTTIADLMGAIHSASSFSILRHSLSDHGGSDQAPGAVRPAGSGAAHAA